MRRYFAEFNRVIGDNIRSAARSLNRMGLKASLLPHKTSLVIERPKSMPWAQFRGAILAVLQPRRGSVRPSAAREDQPSNPHTLGSAIATRLAISAVPGHKPAVQKHPQRAGRTSIHLLPQYP